MLWFGSKRPGEVAVHTCPYFLRFQPKSIFYHFEHRTIQQNSTMFFLIRKKKVRVKIYMLLLEKIIRKDHPIVQEQLC